MKYSRYEFLELFDLEEVIDTESSIYRYIKLKQNFRFILTIFQYDDFASMKLLHMDLDTSLFESGIEKIKEIKIKRSKEFVSINFYRDEISEPLLNIILDPIISISCDLK